MTWSTIKPLAIWKFTYIKSEILATLNRTFAIILFILGASLAALAALGQAVPGYMDAEYYYSGALRLANGDGFTEPYLWNYLDNPVGIAAPFSSLLDALGLYSGSCRDKGVRINQFLGSQIAVHFAVWSITCD